jgi:hypothetical protein
MQSLERSELARARRRGLFTVTLETTRGYVVRLFALRRGQPTLLRSSRECVRPRTARRYATALVRAALRNAKAGAS